MRDDDYHASVQSIIRRSCGKPHEPFWKGKKGNIARCTANQERKEMDTNEASRKSQMNGGEASDKDVRNVRTCLTESSVTTHAAGALPFQRRGLEEMLRSVSRNSFVSGTQTVGPFSMREFQCHIEHRTDNCTLLLKLRLKQKAGSL